MRIARFVAGVVMTASVPLLASPREPSSAPTDTLAVHVNLEFDRSITSDTIKTIARDEATAIWRVYGIDLLWTDPASRPALILDAFVEEDLQRRDVDGSLSVLGYTTIASDPTATTPIRLSFHTVESLIERRHGANPLHHQREVGIALGRVLAHEVGHALLGAPAYHEPGGLMRTTFLSDDLVRPERSSFRLMPDSVARLRGRVVSLSHAQP